jgi:hypothetical protein
VTGDNVASTSFSLDVKRPIELVGALISHFGAGGRMSLEGDLSQLDETVRATGSNKEGLKLRRNTISPRQDFLIVELDDETIPLIRQRVLPSVGLNSRVIHLQIENGGKLVFGAYDNFDRECVWVSEVVGVDLLDRLVADGILRSFKTNPHHG